MKDAMVCENTTDVERFFAPTLEEQLAYEAQSAVAIFSVYLRLSPRQQEFLWNFAAECKERDACPKTAAEYEAVESFTLWLSDVRRGADADQLLLDHHLTQNQLERYERAWDILRSVHEEVQAAVKQFVAESNERRTAAA